MTLKEIIEYYHYLRTFFVNYSIRVTYLISDTKLLVAILNFKTGH